MISGLNIATSTMLPGEISWFKMAARFHFGKNGLPDNKPPIPPDTDLYYKIDLFSYKVRFFLNFVLIFL